MDVFAIFFGYTLIVLYQIKMLTGRICGLVEKDVMTTYCQLVKPVFCVLCLAYALVVWHGKFSKFRENKINLVTDTIMQNDQS